MKVHQRNREGVRPTVMLYSRAGSVGRDVRSPMIDRSENGVRTSHDVATSVGDTEPWHRRAAASGARPPWCVRTATPNTQSSRLGGLEASGAGELRVTIRLIYFDTIRAQFQATYAREIAAGYAAVGLRGPNFSGMDRKSVLTSIAAFEAKLTQSAPAPATQLRPLLTDGLRALGGRYIPVTWM